VYSIKPASAVHNEFNNKPNSFIATYFENNKALKLNDFRIKYASFA